jgi:signal transduction histidine kinase
MDGVARRPNSGSVEVERSPVVEEVKLLLELSRTITGSLDLQEVLDGSLKALRRLIGFDGGSIQLIVDDALMLVASDPPAPPEVYEFRLPIGEGFGGRVATTGEPIYSPDATTDERAHPEGRAKASTAGVRSYFAAPLIQSGRTIGIVQFDSTIVDAFPDYAQALVLAFVPTIAAAVQNAQMFARESRTIAELREAERLKNDFLAVVSHELRTPLTTVIGFAETMGLRAIDLEPEQVGDFARRIETAGRLLMRHIEDLLELSTIERGLMKIRVSSIDLFGALASWGTAEDLAPVAVEVDPALPPVAADPDRLAQVIGNLLSNARKFSPPGSLIRLTAHMEGEGVAISVVDEGRGIAPEMQELIFERFFQVEQAITRSTGGLGVGLYLVRRLCELMGCEVRVRSELGKGTTLTVLVPLAD